MKPGRFEKPVLGSGVEVPVDEDAIGVGQAGGGLADAAFFRSAPDDVHFDAGPGLGEFVSQAHYPLQALVPYQTPYRYEPGIGAASQFRS